LIEVYKVIHGVLSVSFDTSFEFSRSSITRGHSLKLQKEEFVLIYANTSLQSELLIFGTHWSFCERFQKKTVKAAHRWVIFKVVQAYMNLGARPDLWGSPNW